MLLLPGWREGLSLEVELNSICALHRKRLGGAHTVHLTYWIILLREYLYTQKHLVVSSFHVRWVLEGASMSNSHRAVKSC